MLISIIVIFLLISVIGLGYWCITLYSKVNTLKIDLTEAWKQKEAIRRANTQIRRDYHEGKSGNIWFNKMSQYRLAYENLHQSATQLIQSLPNHEQRYLGLYIELNRKF